VFRVAGVMIHSATKVLSLHSGERRDPVLAFVAGSVTPAKATPFAIAAKPPHLVFSAKASCLIISAKPPHLVISAKRHTSSFRRNLRTS
jgi:hypothetical protein